MDPQTEAVLGNSAEPWVSRLWAYLALLQGLYYLVTGVWPLIDILSFEMVTGPKTDDWLVHTVGVLITVIGAVLLVAAWRRRLTGEVALLAIGSAVALTGIDVIYVARGTILPIYLLDAAAEVVLIAAWVVALVQHRRAADLGPRASGSVLYAPSSSPERSYRPSS